MTNLYLKTILYNPNTTPFPEFTNQIKNYPTKTYNVSNTRYYTLAFSEALTCFIIASSQIYSTGVVKVFKPIE